MLRFPAEVGARVRSLAVAGIVTLIAQDASVAVVIVLANSRGGRGALVLYSFAWAVFFVPYAVLAVPIATSAFPELSARADTFDATTATSTRAVTVASWLGVAGMAGACLPLARVFQSHIGQAADARMLAIALATFAPGLVGYGLTANLSRVLYAAGRSSASALAVSGGWLLVIVADLLIVPFVPSSQVVAWLGVGTTIGLTGSGLALLVLVWRFRGPRALRGCIRAAGRGAGRRASRDGRRARCGVRRPGQRFPAQCGRHPAGQRGRARGLPGRRGADRRGRPPRGRTPCDPAVKLALVLGTSTGGTARHVRMLAAGCAARGVRVEVFGPAQTDRDFAFGGAAPGVGFTAVEIADRPRLPGDLRAIGRLRRLFRAWRPDVVHAHGLRAGALAAIAVAFGRTAAGNKQGRPALVVTVHNAPPAGGVTGAIYRVLELIVARNADSVLCVSADLEDRMRAAGARRVGHAVVPAVPVSLTGDVSAETRAALRAEFGADPGQAIVLAVGRLAAQKGFGLLLDAAARWGDIRPAPLLVIAGQGPLAADLQARAASLGLTVRFVGHRPDVPALLSRRRRVRAAQRVGRAVTHPAGGAPGWGTRRSYPGRREPRADRGGRRDPRPARRRPAAGRGGARGARRSRSGRPAARGRRGPGPRPAR